MFPFLSLFLFSLNHSLQNPIPYFPLNLIQKITNILPVSLMSPFSLALSYYFPRTLTPSFSTGLRREAPSRRHTAGVTSSRGPARSYGPLRTVTPPTTMDARCVCVCVVASLLIYKNYLLVLPSADEGGA